MKIILLNPWNESWRNDDGYLPYNAIVDGDKDILIAVNDEHKMKVGSLYLSSVGVVEIIDNVGDYTLLELRNKENPCPYIDMPPVK